MSSQENYTYDDESHQSSTDPDGEWSGSPCCCGQCVWVTRSPHWSNYLRVQKRREAQKKAALETLEADAAEQGISVFARRANIEDELIDKRDMLAMSIDSTSDCLWVFIVPFLLFASVVTMALGAAFHSHPNEKNANIALIVGACGVLVTGVATVAICKGVRPSRCLRASRFRRKRQRSIDAACRRSVPRPIPPPV